MNIHVHWILVLVVFIALFFVNHYWVLDDESRPLRWSFYSLLPIAFVSSGLYCYRFFVEIDRWTIMRSIGLLVSAFVFCVVLWTYRHMWRSRGRKR